MPHLNPLNPSPEPIRVTYPWQRMLGLVLGFLALAVVLYEHHVPWWFWIGPALHAFAWPLLMGWLNQGRADTVSVKSRNLTLNHFFSGLWLPAVSFSLLPFLLLLSLMSMDSVMAGGYRQLGRDLLGQCLGVILGVLMFGLSWHPQPSMLVIIACLPLFLLYPMSVGHASYSALRKLREQNEQMAYLSRHDGLSGLFNRRHWEQLVQVEFARYCRTGQVATLVLIDIDYFKRINDSYGHGEGDKVIRRFAALLRNNIRDIDIAGRYGGEEFGILLPQTTPEAAGALMKRLRNELHRYPLREDMLITASFGIAGLNQYVDNYEKWMRLADQMLYRAKHGGRDRIHVANTLMPEPEPELVLNQVHASLAQIMAQDPNLISQLICGLDHCQAAVVLFDPTDKLAAANAGFMELYAVPAGAQSFDDIVRHSHIHQVGPRIDTDDIDEWLRVVKSKRRSGQTQRSFSVDMFGGRWARVHESVFNGGWILCVISHASNDLVDFLDQIKEPPSFVIDELASSLPSSPLWREGV